MKPTHDVISVDKLTYIVFEVHVCRSDGDLSCDMTANHVEELLSIRQ